MLNGKMEDVKMEYKCQRRSGKTNTQWSYYKKDKN